MLSFIEYDIGKSQRFTRLSTEFQEQFQFTSFRQAALFAMTNINEFRS